MPTKNGSAAREPSARWVRAIRAMVPPSPLLSARIRKTTYLMVTIRISAHSTSETTPSTDISTAWVVRAWCSASRMA